MGSPVLLLPALSLAVGGLGARADTISDTAPRGTPDGLVTTDPSALHMTASRLAQIQQRVQSAAGPIGVGAKSDVVADLVAFTRAKGIYGGLNIEGTLINLSADWNEQYYGKKVLPPDILVRGTATNKQADKLLGDIAKASPKK